MSLQGKTTVSDDFELGGEDEMEPTSSVTSTSLRHKRASQNRRAFLFIKHILYIFILFFSEIFKF